MLLKIIIFNIFLVFPLTNCQFGFYFPNSIPQQGQGSNNYQNQQNFNQFGQQGFNNFNGFPVWGAVPNFNNNNQQPSHTYTQPTTTVRYTQSRRTQNPYQTRPTSGYYNGKRISDQKCEEYEKYTYEEFYGGGLSGDSKPSIHKSSKCSSSTGLIVGGQNAEEREFPHMVAIGYGFEGSYEYACGGTLISEQFVLTAAHCERANGGAARIVKLGTNNLKSQNSQDVPVASFIKYPKYNSISKFADIALIKMQRPVSLEIGGIRPACLHTGSSSLFSRNKAVATGWGSIEYGDVSSDILQKVTLDIFTSDVCEKDYDKVFKEHICAGKTIEKLDTCQGDSGGPLQVPKNDNSCLWYVVGITSYGKGCGLRIPSIYTRVNTPEFLDWIEGIVWRS